MIGGTPVRREFTFTVSTASGSSYLPYPSEERLGARGVTGLVNELKARIASGADHEFSTLKVTLIDADPAFVTPGSYLADPDNYADDVVVGADENLALDEFSPSDTDAVITKSFVTDGPPVFSHGLLVAIEWTTADGSGHSTVIVTVGMEIGP